MTTQNTNNDNNSELNSAHRSRSDMTLAGATAAKADGVTDSGIVCSAWLGSVFSYSGLGGEDNQKKYQVEIMTPYRDGYIRSYINVTLLPYIWYKIITTITQRLPKLSQYEGVDFSGTPQSNA
jgi:hypothetical protein